MTETATPAFNQEKKKTRQTPEQKIAALEKQQSQLKARIAKEKSKVSQANRKLDTRRKIVAGAIALENMEHDENFKNVMEGLLKRHVADKDKALFGL